MFLFNVWNFSVYESYESLEGRFWRWVPTSAMMQYELINIVIAITSAELSTLYIQTLSMFAIYLV